MKQTSLWEGARLTLEGAVDLTAQSLNAYGHYKTWVVAYSGGKDSSATLSIVDHLIRAGRVQRPERLIVLYADTRMELPPLHDAAMQMLDYMRARGHDARVVLPAMDNRFFVYMLGRGVPPPSNTFRWCTSQIKIEPMEDSLLDLRNETGEKMLMITGVRNGESAVRDQRISISCGKNGAECGQGWFQSSTPESVADTLAPLLHWRVCHVWDWLMFGDHGLPMADVATVYGGEEAEEINARTGCVGCNLASRDTALERILLNPKYQYLYPLRRLRSLYAELKRPQNRLRKDGSETRKDGSLVSNPMRLGPLTMAARLWGLGQVKAIQAEVGHGYSLIDDDEEQRIRHLIAVGTWPNGWAGNEAVGDVMMDEVLPGGAVQPLVLGKVRSLQVLDGMEVQNVGRSAI